MNLSEDPYTLSLLHAARGALEATGAASPMLVGTLDGRERICLMLGSWEDEETTHLRYVQALILCLYSGADTLYELREILTRTVDPTEEEIVPPEMDPLSRNAILVLRTDVKTGKESGVYQPFSITDIGTPSFDEELHDAGVAVGGTHSRTVKRILKTFNEMRAPRTLDAESLNTIRMAIPFMGRVSYEGKGS